MELFARTASVILVIGAAGAPAAAGQPARTPAEKIALFADHIRNSPGIEAALRKSILDDAAAARARAEKAAAAKAEAEEKAAGEAPGDTGDGAKAEPEEKGAGEAAGAEGKAGERKAGGGEKPPSTRESAAEGQPEDFILRSLERFRPALGEAGKKIAGGDPAAARALLDPLEKSADPYVTAHARLLLADLDRRDGRHEDSIRRAEEVLRKDRERIIPDYRACELAALGYGATERRVLEALEYAILLIDFPDAPRDVRARALARATALQADGRSPVTAIGEWMDTVGRWVRDLKTGSDPTGKKQDDIVAALDKLIDLQDARERNTCPNCGKLG